MQEAAAASLRLASVRPTCLAAADSPPARRRAASTCAHQIGVCPQAASATVTGPPSRRGQLQDRSQRPPRHWIGPPCPPERSMQQLKTGARDMAVQADSEVALAAPWPSVPVPARALSIFVPSDDPHRVLASVLRMLLNMVSFQVESDLMKTKIPKSNQKSSQSRRSGAGMPQPTQHRLPLPTYA